MIDTAVPTHPVAAGARAGEALARRLVRCLPGATFEMETFCALAGVVATEAVPTAAVECRPRPRLLLNPRFVAERCRRDEHLFLLVMHELWHVLLAHTSVWPGGGEDENVAFDAVINAGLSHAFPGVEYRGFLDAVNPPDAFPGLLLRPPPGWPEQPDYAAAGPAGPAGTRRLLRRLYPPPGVTLAPPTYEELLALLRRERDGRRVAPVLLGGHGHELSGRTGPLLTDILRRVTASWPAPPGVVGGHLSGPGGAAAQWRHALDPPERTAQAALRRAIRRALRPGGGVPRTGVAVDTTRSAMGVVPDARDRTAAARRALGASPVLWRRREETRTRRPEGRFRTHAYLDVSGSMDRLLPALLGLLAPEAGAGRVEVFQFSAGVETLSAADLRRGRLRTTWGTDLTPVLHHALDTPRLQRILVVTDGYVGDVPADTAERVRRAGLEVHVVLAGAGARPDQVAAVATTVTVLPGIGSVAT